MVHSPDRSRPGCPAVLNMGAPPVNVKWNGHLGFMKAPMSAASSRSEAGMVYIMWPPW